MPFVHVYCGCSFKSREYNDIKLRKQNYIELIIIDTL